MKHKNTNLYTGIVVVAVLLIAAIALFSHRGTKSDAQQQNNSQNNQPQAATTSEPATTDGMVWQGTLQQSDSPAKGNLMLVTGKTTIYISTNHNYSTLIGKEVTVSYKGTINNFTLQGITAK